MSEEYESDEVCSDYSDTSDLESLEHSYGDEEKTEIRDDEEEEVEESKDEGSFEVREINDGIKKEDDIKRLQKEDERIAPVPADQRISLDVLTKY